MSHNLQLMQIEQTDFALLKDALNKHGKRNKLIGNQEIYLPVTDYCFSVKSSIPGDFKKSIVGFSFIQKLNWISRHAEFVLLAARQEKELMAEMIEVVLEFGFDQLNLNKMWIEITPDEIFQEVLPDLGFVLEGVRRKAKFYKGEWIDTQIFGLLQQERPL